jgi:hypothetical protein
MEPAESSPIVNNQSEADMPKAVADDVTMDTSKAPDIKESDDKPSNSQPQGSWSSWGNAIFSAASSSVKALEHGVAKVLDVIEDNGGKDETAATPTKAEIPSETLSQQEANAPMLPLPTGVKDDLRTLSSAVQRTSGKLMTSGFGMLSALGRRTLEVLVADEEAAVDPLRRIDSSLSSRLREARDATALHEKEQKRQLAYWFDISGGNDSFEAFRCFSQSSLHSINGKIELCSVQADSDSSVVPETYKKIAEVLSASSDRLIRAWDSADFAQTPEEGDLLDSKILAALLKDRLPLLTAPTDRLCSSLDKARKDLLSADLTQDAAYEMTLSNLANFTAATIDFLHKSVQLLHASALSTHAVQTQPGKGSFIRSECTTILETAASFSTACLVLALRIRAISIAGKSAVIKTIPQSSAQPDDESSPELVATSLDMEATDCAAHLAKMLGFLVPVEQHLLLLRLYGADCRPQASVKDDDDDK